MIITIQAYLFIIKHTFSNFKQIFDINSILFDIKFASTVWFVYFVWFYPKQQIYLKH